MVGEQYRLLIHPNRSCAEQWPIWQTWMNDPKCHTIYSFPGLVLFDYLEEKGMSGGRLLVGGQQAENCVIVHLGWLAQHLWRTHFEIAVLVSMPAIWGYRRSEQQVVEMLDQINQQWRSTFSVTSEA